MSSKSGRVSFQKRYKTIFTKAHSIRSAESNIRVFIIINRQEQGKWFWWNSEDDTTWLPQDLNDLPKERRMRPEDVAQREQEHMARPVQTRQSVLKRPPTYQHYMIDEDDTTSATSQEQEQVLEEVQEHTREDAQAQELEPTHYDSVSNAIPRLTPQVNARQAVELQAESMDTLWNQLIQETDTKIFDTDSGLFAGLVDHVEPSLLMYNDKQEQDSVIRPNIGKQGQEEHQSAKAQQLITSQRLSPQRRPPSLSCVGSSVTSLHPRTNLSSKVKKSQRHLNLRSSLRDSPLSEANSSVQRRMRMIRLRQATSKLRVHSSNSS